MMGAVVVVVVVGGAATSVAPPLQRPSYFAPTDAISLSLDAIAGPGGKDGSGATTTTPAGRRFFRCPAAVTIHHFQKLLSLKFELGPNCSVIPLGSSAAAVVSLLNGNPLKT